MRTVRIFVSSPGDAQFERKRVDRVVERLTGEFAGVVRIDTIRWEREFYKAHTTFQAQIPEAKDCDIVVTILRHRLGTELPDDFPTMPSGDRYPSGTAYELLSAIEARKQQNLPDVYVFRYSEQPTVRIDDIETNALVKEQWEKLKVFFETWFETPEGHFRAAFHKFRSTDDFEAQFELLLRGWFEDNILKGRSVVWPIETKGSPFRGLAAFGAGHATVFFGRSREIARATDDFKDAAERGAPFLLVVGASGAGKSSLVQAGLVPRLTSAGVVPSVDVWRVAMMRPGEHADGPLAALASRLFGVRSHIGDGEERLTPALPELSESDYGTPAELAALLAHGDDTVASPILRALDKAGEKEREEGGFDCPVRASLLVVLDQLDEIFTGDLDNTEQTAFVRVLTVLAATGRVWIVATLRADLYEIFLKDPMLLDLKSRGASFDLSPPRVSELNEIVRAPVAAAGLVYETDPETREGLDERLLRDAEAPDMLPLLQFTLDQLFEQRETVGDEVRLTIAAYDRLGGLEGAIDKQAEKAIADLAPDAIEALPKLLRLLAAQNQAYGSSGSSHYTIRSVRLADVVEDEAVRRLVNALSRARILVVSDEGTGATVRLAHERVVECWGRARRAVRTNAEFYRILHDVRSQFGRWMAGGLHPSTLLQRGKPLRDAQILIKDYPDTVSARILNFISASLYKNRFRKIVWITILSLPALLFFESVLNTFGIAIPDKASQIYGIVVIILYQVAIIINLALYQRRITTARKFMDNSESSGRSASALQMTRYATALGITKYGLATVLIVASLVASPAFFWGSDAVSSLLGASEEETDNVHNFIVTVFIVSLIFAVPFINAVTMLTFRYGAESSRTSRAATAKLPRRMEWLAPYSLPALALLAGFSGTLSGIAVPTIGSALPKDAIFDPAYYVPPVLFGCVLGIGELCWANQRLRTFALIVGVTIIAWMLAYATGFTTATLLPLGAWAPGILAAGLIGGGVGAFLSALALPTLRRARRLEISMFVGAIAGLCLWLPFELGWSSIYMFIAWQMSFACYLGFCLQRPV